MRTHAQKQNKPQQQSSHNIRRSSAKPLAASPIAHPILHLQRTIGNQAIQRLFRANAECLEVGSDTSAITRFAHDFSRTPVSPEASVKLQAKLTINTPGDIYEREADHISEQVMLMPEPELQNNCACGGGCSECQTKQSGREHESVQTKRVQAGETRQVATPSIVPEVLAAPGQPLDPATRGFMEPRFGHDFSGVRIHTGSVCHRVCKSVECTGLHGRAQHCVWSRTVCSKHRYRTALASA